MAVAGNALYVFGGMVEVGDREISFDDMWCGNRAGYAARTHLAPHTNINPERLSLSGRALQNSRFSHAAKLNLLKAINAPYLLLLWPYSNARAAPPQLALAGAAACATGAAEPAAEMELLA